MLSKGKGSHGGAERTSNTCRNEVRSSQAKHRGVSAPSFCDGAIPRQHRSVKKRHRGDHGVVKTTYPAITLHGHRGVSASSSRDDAIPQHHRSVKKDIEGIAGS